MTGPMTELDLRRLGPDFAVPMFVVQGLDDDFTPAAGGIRYCRPTIRGKNDGLSPVG